MTLKNQIREISIRWFNHEFHKHVSVTTLVNSLAIESFRKLMETHEDNLTPQDHLDFKAVYVALRQMDRGEFADDLLAVK